MKILSKLRQTAALFCLIGAMIAMTGGCGKGSVGGNSAFDKSPPEMKKVWDDSAAADKANDYLKAILGYQSLLAQQDKLSTEQVQALKDTLLAINQRLYAAANNGDAQARAAQTELAKMQAMH